MVPVMIVLMESIFSSYSCQPVRMGSIVNARTTVSPVFTSLLARLNPSTFPVYPSSVFSPLIKARTGLVITFVAMPKALFATLPTLFMALPKLPSSLVESFRPKPFSVIFDTFSKLSPTLSKSRPFFSSSMVFRLCFAPFSNCSLLKYIATMRSSISRLIRTPPPSRLHRPFRGKSAG